MAMTKRERQELDEGEKFGPEIVCKNWSVNFEGRIGYRIWTWFENEANALPYE